MSENNINIDSDNDSITGKSILLSELKSRSISGGIVSGAAQIVEFFLRIIGIAVLARLLTPGDFGVVAMVTVVMNFARMVSTLGLSTATIQNKDISSGQISNLFWINTVFGVLLFGFVAVLSPLVGMFFGDERVIMITIALSVSLLFVTVSNQHRAILTRNMRFNILAGSAIAGTAIGIAVGITAALLGAGYWSLVVMPLVNEFVRSLIVVIANPWRPARPRALSNIIGMMKLGGGVVGFNFINYFTMNADNLIIGKLFGTTALGFYNRAYTLMLKPLNQLRGPITQVALPALSRLQDSPDVYRHYYSRILQILSFLSAPLTLFMAANSDTVIQVVLGAGWEKAIPLFRVLCIVGAIQVVLGTTGLVMMSCGLGGRYLLIGIITAVVSICAFLIGSMWGVFGIAVAYAVANVLLVFPVLIISFRNTPVTLAIFFRSIEPQYRISLIAVGLGYAITRLFTVSNPILSLLMSLVSFCLIFFSVSLFFKEGREALTQVRRILMTISKKFGSIR
jgi:PST family polysaccharide transporter